LRLIYGCCSLLLTFESPYLTVGIFVRDWLDLLRFRFLTPIWDGFSFQAGHRRTILSMPSVSRFRCSVYIFLVLEFANSICVVFL